ncbi:unnamed protein product [Caenorhabditis bovis]|uniref:Uncharacterized protein n=1 Tax=Caenorhabditis bovis TaxID=2654633 RepID=A0A8S1EFY1_9PELO|nr:unnamed protein product [Caenorhabditis bovis]
MWDAKTNLKNIIVFLNTKNGYGEKLADIAGKLLNEMARADQIVQLPFFHCHMCSPMDRYELTYTIAKLMTISKNHADMRELFSEILERLHDEPIFIGEIELWKELIEELTTVMERISK